VLADPQRTFATFIVGASNASAIAAVRRALHRSRPSLLLLRGVSGVGKTHLLHAAANELIRRNPILTFKTANEINIEYVDAILCGRVAEFRRAIVGGGALLVDAMEDTCHTPAFRDELRDLVRTLRRDRRPVILATGPEHGVIERMIRAEPNAEVANLGRPAIHQRLTALADLDRARLRASETRPAPC
jgi:chromosomal replication initiator protein